MLARFCDAIGEYEPFNRFLLLHDGPVLNPPTVTSDEEYNQFETECCHCIIDHSYQWLVERISDIGKYRIDSCDEGDHVPRYPCDYETLIDHANAPRKYCIFHKLILEYISTLVDLEQRYRLSKKDFHLCGSTEQVIHSIDFPSSNTE